MAEKTVVGEGRRAKPSGGSGEGDPCPWLMDPS